MLSESEDNNPQEDDFKAESPVYGSPIDDALYPEAFQALKQGYEHLKKKYHNTNDSNNALRQENKKLNQEIERLKESGERIQSYDISPEVAESNKMFILQTKVDELQTENTILKSIVTAHESGNSSDTQCQSKDCQKQKESLQEKIIQLETSIETLRKDLVKVGPKDVTQGQRRSISEDTNEKDTDMETDGNDGAEDLVEFDINKFILDYKQLKEEVKSLLKEVNTYKKLKDDGLLEIRKRKSEEPDFEMEDYEKRGKTNPEYLLHTSMGQGSSEIKRPPKDELSTTSKFTSTESDDDDIYSAHTSSDDKYSQHLNRPMQSFKETRTLKPMSASYGPITDLQARPHFQPGSAPNVMSSNYIASPSSVLLGRNSPKKLGSQVSDFRIPIMQETGGGLLPPRNPPNIETDLDIGGRNSPEFYTPVGIVDKPDQAANLGATPDITLCPICSRQFDRCLFSAEYINGHVNSHFDGTSEYEFVDMIP
ncbi:uncharacterized protein [Antedon mediterranea]|uniref:uncharacterized protein n=1 Tax=Antedon mediterranea TaxID=105859 RepID=UPI003AF4A36C